MVTCKQCMYMLVESKSCTYVRHAINQCICDFCYTFLQAVFLDFFLLKLSEICQQIFVTACNRSPCYFYFILLKLLPRPTSKFLLEFFENEILITFPNFVKCAGYIREGPFVVPR